MQWRAVTAKSRSLRAQLLSVETAEDMHAALVESLVVLGASANARKGRECRVDNATLRLRLVRPPGEPISATHTIPSALSAPNHPPQNHPNCPTWSGTRNLRCSRPSTLHNPRVAALCLLQPSHHLSIAEPVLSQIDRSLPLVHICYYDPGAVMSSEGQPQGESNIFLLLSVPVPRHPGDRPHRRFT